MEATLFAKMLSDQKLTDLKKLGYKYPQADMREFVNLLKSGFYQTPDGLQISCRNIKGAAIEKDKKIDKYYNQAQGVLSGLRAAYAN